MLNKLINFIESFQFETDEYHTKEEYIEDFQSWKEKSGMIFSFMGPQGFLVTLGKKEPRHSYGRDEDFFVVRVSKDSGFFQVGEFAMTVPFPVKE